MDECKASCWRLLPVLNAEYQVIDIIQTFF
jgi:hypothetical protein